jgi:carbamoyltransferase
LRVQKKFWLLPVFSAYLGPEFDQRDIDRRLTAVGARFSTVSRNDMLDTTAKALAEGEAIGWFQGRMEFGPRALGNRSILGDPRSPSMQKNLDLKVKYRESFQAVRPFSAARRGGELV